MNDSTADKPEEPRFDEAFKAAVRVLDARGAGRLLIIDFTGAQAFTDHFVICHGLSDRQVKSLADEVIAKVKQAAGRKPSVEGYAEAEWILLDYGDFVVHVFQEVARDFYGLERLWGDLPQVDPASVVA